MGFLARNIFQFERFWLVFINGFLIKNTCSAIITTVLAGKMLKRKSKIITRQLD